VGEGGGLHDCMNAENWIMVNDVNESGRHWRLWLVRYHYQIISPPRPLPSHRSPQSFSFICTCGVFLVI